MRVVHALLITALLLVGQPRESTSGSVTENASVAAPNDNRHASGTLRNGVLTVAIEAGASRWYPNGEAMPGRAVAAFNEVGKKPVVPGPLIRVPMGTEIRIAVRNRLDDTLVFQVPAALRGVANSGLADSVVLAPGQGGELRTSASTPGNYIYRAAHRDPLGQALQITGQLTGAIVVDSSATPSVDRIMVVTLSTDSVTAAGVPAGHVVFAINGMSWPQTERLSATVGDSTHWRVLNASQAVHPMHLHGFYFRVDAFRLASPTSEGGMDGQLAVTQAMPPFSTLSMSWVPERPGNWLFHCHFQQHLVPPAPLELPPNVVAPAARRREAQALSAHVEHQNHALTGMSGLVMAVTVAERQGARVGSSAGGMRRSIRLLAIEDAGFPDSAPSMRFAIEENGRRIDAGPGFSPTLNLKRGESVSITVVNTLRTSTSVHWHGIELESYFDGVAGLSGTAARLAPMIAPRDSFVARFTPPRAGTFIYHSHVDEPRTHRAGMLGAMIVREGEAVAPADERIFFLKAARTGSDGVPIDVNGQANPDTVVIPSGRTTRLRFIALTVINPAATIAITSRPDSSFPNRPDNQIVPMLMVAKDGAELPAHARRTVSTRMNISMGETYDFEFAPTQPGNLRLEVRGGAVNARLLARVPIVVR